MVINNYTIGGGDSFPPVPPVQTFTCKKNKAQNGWIVTDCNFRGYEGTEITIPETLLYEGENLPIKGLENCFKEGQMGTVQKVVIVPVIDWNESILKVPTGIVEIEFNNISDNTEINNSKLTFKDNKTIRSIKYQSPRNNGITSIQDGVFSNSGIDHNPFPNLRIINGQYCFNQCNSIINFVAPELITVTGYYSFAVQRIKNLTVGDLKNVDSDFLSQAVSIENIYTREEYVEGIKQVLNDKGLSRLAKLVKAAPIEV